MGGAASCACARLGVEIATDAVGTCLPARNCGVDLVITLLPEDLRTNLAGPVPGVVDDEEGGTLVTVVLLLPRPAGRMAAVEAYTAAGEAATGLC